MKYLDQKQINSKLNTVKIFATSIVILFSLQSYAQNSTYPTLPNKGAQITDFIPDNYFILKQSEGDLTGNGKEDAVLILESEHDVEEQRYPEDTSYWENNKARILVVLHQNQDETYEKQIQNNTFLRRSSEGGIYGDPLAGLEISSNQVLSIHYYGGSNWRWSDTFKFRFQDNNYYLIGADHLYYWTLSNNYREWSFNFLTNQMKFEKG
nr:hypothetical protein [Saprospiraceae bacterium]